MSNYFKEPKLKALFSFQQLYVGLSPYNAPGVFSLLAATELTDGVWYPIGGFGKVRDGFLKVITELGVDLRMRTPVEKLLVEQGPDGSKRCTGVRLKGGEELMADVVVANPDLPYVYEELLEAPAEAQAEIDSEVTRLNKYAHPSGLGSGVRAPLFIVRLATLSPLPRTHGGLHEGEQAGVLVQRARILLLPQGPGARAAAAQRIPVGRLQGLMGPPVLSGGPETRASGQLLRAQPLVHRHHYRCVILSGLRMRVVAVDKIAYHAARSE